MAAGWLERNGETSGRIGIHTRTLDTHRDPVVPIATQGIDRSYQGHPGHSTRTNEERPMNSTTSGLARAVVLAGAFLAIGASAGSAAPASPGKGTGCDVGDANDQYYFDPACKAHTVLKLDADGNLAFYEYQDAGRLPSDAARPASAIHRSYDACYRLGIGVVCGTIVETITPGGAYKSSFMSH